MSRKIITQFAAILTGGSIFLALSWAQNNAPRPQRDPVEQAQRPSPVKPTRPEQQKNSHDNSDVFDASRAEADSPVFQTQPKQGKLSGFDFARDPLNADRPMQKPEEIMQKEI